YEPGQADVLAQGHDDAAGAHHRGRDHDVQGHEHEHLDLWDVIGVACDQGRGAELSDLEHRQIVDLPVDGAAQVAADAHARAGAEEDRVIAVMTWTRQTSSIVMPVDQMKSVSPSATPSSMMRALRLGR